MKYEVLVYIDLEAKDRDATPEEIAAYKMKNETEVNHA